MRFRFTYLAIVVAGLFAGAAAAGCDSDLTLGSDQPHLSGSDCGLHLDEESCVADTAGGCSWIAILAPCQIQPDGTTVCPPAGACYGPDDGGGGGGGGGVGGTAGCICPDGAVCVVSAGAPDVSDIGCEAPQPDCTSADPCQCLRGSCYESPSIEGLCICE